MRAVPDRLRHGAPGALGYLFRQAGNEVGVFAGILGEAVRLGTADGNDEEIVLPESILDLFAGHRLVVEAGRPLHVSALRRDLPVAHEYHLRQFGWTRTFKAPSILSVKVR